MGFKEWSMSCLMIVAVVLGGLLGIYVTSTVDIQNPQQMFTTRLLGALALGLFVSGGWGALTALNSSWHIATGSYPDVTDAFRLGMVVEKLFYLILVWTLATGSALITGFVRLLWRLL